MQMTCHARSGNPFIAGTHASPRGAQVQFGAKNRLDDLLGDIDGVLGDDGKNPGNAVLKAQPEADEFVASRADGFDAEDLIHRRPELRRIVQSLQERKEELRAQVKDPAKQVSTLLAKGVTACPTRVQSMANLEMDVIDALENHFDKTNASKSSWMNIRYIAMIVRDGMQVPQERQYIRVYQKYAHILDPVLERYLSAVGRRDAMRVNDDEDKTPGYMLWQLSDAERRRLEEANEEVAA